MVFKDSYTIPEQGVSVAIIEHRGKQYTGKARLHPDDKEKWSEFTGCRYAEMRAQIAALKQEHKEEKQACEECRKFVKSVSCYKNFDKTSPIVKDMYRQLNIRIKEVNKIADVINSLEMQLRASIRLQDNINSKAKKG